MKREVLKGHLDLLLLAAVASGAAHGYAIIEALREQSGGSFDLPEGTVYPALHRLERAGVLASRWSTTAGRRRRLYRLTRAGVAALDEQRDQWTAFASGVNAVLEGLV